MRFAASSLLALIALLLLAAPSLADDPKPADADPFAKWEPSIAQFEEADAKSPPPKGAVLFVGSSSIRLWDVAKSFPQLETINRGFGGSEVADSVHFADRIVTKYEPRTVVLYAGDNDIAKGKTAERVHADFRAFVRKVRAKLPETRIVFVAIKPSIKRWELIETIRRANALVAADCAQDDRLSFVDVDGPMLGEDGKPRAELLREDGLHLNDRGYELWTKLVRPHVAK
jgi:lysophospholipase L1-like esterase